MTHNNADGAKLRALAHDVLNDPLGKANHIVTLLKAVHASKPAVGVLREHLSVCCSCWENVHAR